MTYFELINQLENLFIQDEINPNDTVTIEGLKELIQKYKDEF